MIPKLGLHVRLCGLIQGYIGIRATPHVDFDSRIRQAHELHFRSSRYVISSEVKSFFWRFVCQIHIYDFASKPNNPA